MVKPTDAFLPNRPTVTELVIGLLLEGLEVRVVVEGVERVGYIHNLDLAVNSVFENVYALVTVDGLDDSIRVSINKDGSVDILDAEN